MRPTAQNDQDKSTTGLSSTLKTASPALKPGISKASSGQISHKKDAD